MLRYVIKKMFYSASILFGVVTVVFFLFNFKSGDVQVARQFAGERATPELIQQIEHDLGLDMPLFDQYLLFLNDISPLSLHNPAVEESHIYLDTAKYSHVELINFSDNRTLVMKWPYFRRSYVSDRPVSEMLWQAFPSTMILALCSIFIAGVLGIFLGIIAALNKGTFFDNAATVFAVLGMSGPSYFMAVIIAIIGGYLWSETTSLPMLPFVGMLLGLMVNIGMQWYRRRDSHFGFSVGPMITAVFKGGIAGFAIWIVAISTGGLGEWIPLSGSYLELPGTGLSTQGKLWDTDDYGNEFFNPKNLILPAITLGIRPLAVVLQLMRSALLDVLTQDYVRTAKAKGLSTRAVVMKHALKNALIPVVTALSGWFASLLAGAIFVEYIFNLDGIGYEIFEAIMNNDLPVIIGSSLVISFCFVVINFMVDVVYGFLDPRIRVR